MAAAMCTLTGCGSQASGVTSPSPTVRPPTSVATRSPATIATPTNGASTCQPAASDGNGGPYPAAISTDCTGTREVTIDVIGDPKIGGGFAPSNITISHGTTVTFIWKSSGHNLSPFVKDLQDVGYTYRKTFGVPGDYPYQCQIHAGMNGVIHVR